MSKNITLLGIPSWLIAMLLVSTTSHASDDPRPTMDMVRQEQARAASVTVQELEAFISRTHWEPGDGTEARIVVQAAGNSGNAEFRPVLKRAAETWSTGGFSSLTFYALHNLWKLGEPPEYFLQNVRRHKENPELAVRSALVWGRDATEQTLPELERIANGAPPGSALRNHAYPLVRHAVDYYRGYAKLKDLDEKADFVLRYAGSGFNRFGGQGGDPVGGEDPRAYWARRELLDLCRQDPELVARRVLAVDPLKPVASPLYDARWEYVAQFLDDKAAAAYRRLKAPSDEAAKRAANENRPDALRDANR